MRIVVVGTSGAGKTALARELALQLHTPHIELDAINWQPNWWDLNGHDPATFACRVSQATKGKAWVVDGNYGQVRDQVWQRATHLVWLDYDRWVVMARVIRRSFLRIVLGTELWSGNQERWSHVLRPGHPIRWAWTTWSRQRQETGERLVRPEHAELLVLRLRHPREARRAIRQLMAEAAGEA